LHHSHIFSKDSHLDRRGRYKVYATVKKINEELDELTKRFLMPRRTTLEYCRGLRI